MLPSYALQRAAALEDRSIAAILQRRQTFYADLLDSAAPMIQPAAPKTNPMPNQISAAIVPSSPATSSNAVASMSPPLRPTISPIKQPRCARFRPLSLRNTRFPHTAHASALPYDHDSVCHYSHLHRLECCCPDYSAPYPQRQAHSTADGAGFAKQLLEKIQLAVPYQVRQLRLLSYRQPNNQRIY